MGDENVPPQLQFEKVPLKLIVEAPRPTKRSFQELKQHAAAREEAETPSSKRARVGAWVAAQSQKFGMGVTQIVVAAAQAVTSKLKLVPVFQMLPSRQAAVARAAVTHALPITPVVVKASPKALKEVSAKFLPENDKRTELASIAALPGNADKTTEDAIEVGLEEETAWALLEEAQDAAETPDVQVGLVGEVAHEVPARAFEALAASQGLHETQVEPPADTATEVLHLPAPWQIHLNEEYAAYYYHNPITGVSQWEMPVAWQ